jgi:outer membrane protein TolC
MVLGMVGACSREHYKASADKEAYKIIEEKWQDDFGQMANYRISDAEPDAAVVEAMVPPSRVLTLAKAVEIATNHSREYQSQKESLYLSALSLTLTRHRYAPLWFGTIDARYAKNAGGEDITTSGEAGVNQTFLWANGVQMTSGLAFDWMRLLTGDPRTSLGSVLSATLTAPLLGAGAGQTAWENLTQAERNMLYRIRSFNRYRQTFVVSFISDYYRVLQQRESVIIQEASYRRLVDSTNRVRMEVEVGQRPRNDLGEAEQRLLSAEQSLVSVRQRYEQTLDSFKIRLALPTDAEIALDPDELTALAELGVNVPDYTAQEAVEIALSHRLDLANTRDGVDDTRRKLVLAAKGLGVQLDITSTANVPWDQATQPGARVGFNDGTYGVGLNADLPFDRKSERNAYRQALISMQQDLRGYDEEVDRVKLAVRQAYRDLVETADSYRIQQIGLELARRRVEFEELQLEYGRGTVRLLLESEDALVQSQNALLGALVDHTVAKMSFFRDIGIMQVRPDGMWEQPAK